MIVHTTHYTQVDQYMMISEEIRWPRTIGENCMGDESVRLTNITSRESSSARRMSSANSKFSAHPQAEGSLVGSAGRPSVRPSAVVVQLPLPVR